MVSSARLNWMKWEKIRIRVRVEMRVRIAIMIEIGTRMENEQIRGQSHNGCNLIAPKIQAWYSERYFMVGSDQKDEGKDEDGYEDEVLQ